MKKADVEHFELVSSESLAPGIIVHVEGWVCGAVFVYQNTVNGLHTLKTPRKNKVYKTRNRLLHTRHDSDKLRAVNDGISCNCEMF